MRKPYFVFMLMALLACNDDQPAPSTVVNLRITNVSQYDYTDVLVIAGTEEFNYGSIGAGQSSEYHEFKAAYGYGYVELKIGGVRYKYQPIDYVGARFLKQGNYSYQMNAIISDDRLELTLAED